MPRIQEYVSDEKSAYYDINDNNLKKYSGAALESYSGIARSSYQATFQNLQTGISSKPGLNRRNYEYYREDEAIPTKYNNIIAMAEKVYNNFGIIQSIIDLMGDFVIDGIRPAHPSPRIQRFYREWFRKVGGEDRSERFTNNFYKLGTVIVRSQKARVPLKKRKELYRGTAAVDMVIEDMKTAKNVLPWKYTFLHPCKVDVVGGDVSSFLQNPQYVLDMSDGLKNYLKKSGRKDVLGGLPTEIRRSIVKDEQVLLPKDSTFVYYYRKDDWEVRPLPMLYGIFRNIIMLEKLFLADMAALDGATSKIRVWKLGSVEHRIAPTSLAIDKLDDIMQTHTGGGVMDIIWDDAISLIESDTNIHDFLGEEKYKPHLTQIYAGIGIPPTLTGFAGGGTTNNFVSLKTFLRRLRYGRSKLIEFWNEQFRQVQKAMGFREPAVLEFKFVDLSEESAMKALLIQMSDRNLISDELLQSEFDYDPKLEGIRLLNEEKMREKNKHVKKSGPYHDPQFDIALQKIALQRGYLSPGQVGVEVIPGTEEEVSPFTELNDMKKQGMQDAKDNARNQQEGQVGRPQGSKDKQKRKEKKFTPVSKASLDIWVGQSQSKISKLMRPHLLKQFGKDSLRKLTLKEAEIAQCLKFGVLYNIEPYSAINKGVVKKALSIPIKNSVLIEYKNVCKGAKDTLGRPLIYEECKRIESLLYGANHESNS